MLTYAFDDGSSRIDKLGQREYADRLNIEKIVQISQAANNDINNIFGDIKILNKISQNYQIQIEHLFLLMPFQQHLTLMSNMYRDQVTTLYALHSTLNNQYSLISQEIEHYSGVINKCITKTLSCDFSDSGQFCRDHCFLHSDDEFLTLHFIKKLHDRRTFSHITCFHGSLGETFKFTHNIFQNNSTHFLDVYKADLIIDFQCLSGNIIGCQKYWSLQNSPDFIFNCIKSQVYATGNITFFKTDGTKGKLSFTPTLLTSEIFPIKIQQEILYKEDVCSPVLQDLHHKVLQLRQKENSLSYHIFGERFYDSIPNLNIESLVETSTLNNSSFKDHLRSILTKVKNIDIDEFHNHVTSSHFLLIIFLIIFTLLLLIMCCCCPTLLVSITKCLLLKLYGIFKILIQLTLEAFQKLFQIVQDRLAYLYSKLNQQEQVNTIISPPASSPSTQILHPQEPPSYDQSAELVPHPLFPR